ncbi:hypothetical protein ABN214_15465 [Proteus terrae]|uniref:hypothetical protein n=1 Tax=Proteus terrae TaxID=1574161 RepID=UPI0032DA60C9
MVTRVAIVGGMSGIGLVIAEQLARLGNVETIRVGEGFNVGSLWNTNMYSYLYTDHYVEDPLMHRDYLLGRKGNKPIKCSPRHKGRACKKKSKRGR